MLNIAPFQNRIDELWANDPLCPYYNRNGLTDIALTCDVDWAPDYAIESVLNAVEANGLTITLFATHHSAVLSSLPAFAEVGLHPDYTRITDREGFRRKIEQLREIYPQARGHRSHRNLFGQNIADLLSEHDVEYDVSAILWNAPFLKADFDFNGMMRFPYMWEDGIHLDMNWALNWGGVQLQTPGLKILNCHPVLIYLNSASDNHRRAVTSRYTDLTQAPRNEIDPEIHTGRGIGDLWRDMLKWVADSGIRTHRLSDWVDVAKADREQAAA